MERVVVPRKACMESSCLQPMYATKVSRVCLRNCRWAEGDLHKWSALSYPDALHAYMVG